jgi:hypothetical protein
LGGVNPGSQNLGVRQKNSTLFTAAEKTDNRIMAPLICLKMKSFYRYPDYGATDLPENGQLLQISGLWRH